MIAASSRSDTQRQSSSFPTVALAVLSIRERCGSSPDQATYPADRFPTGLATGQCRPADGVAWRESPEGPRAGVTIADESSRRRRRRTRARTVEQRTIPRPVRRMPPGASRRLRRRERGPAAAYEHGVGPAPREMGLPDLPNAPRPSRRSVTRWRRRSHASRTRSSGSVGGSLIARSSVR
jgi:hypothetical protein